MEGIGIFIAVIVAVLLVVALMRGVTPSTKTDSQLMLMHRQALKSGRMGEQDRLKIEAEMHRRGILDGAGNMQTRQGGDHLIQLRATNIRIGAHRVYREGWDRAKAQNKSDRICHETGLTAVLLHRLQEEPDCPPLSEEIIELIMLEQMPFNIMAYEEGMEAMVEYVVWREYPGLANEGVIKGAVEALRNDGGGDYKDCLNCVPWTKFL